MPDYHTFADVEKRLRDDLSSLYDIPSERDDLDDDITATEAEVNSYVGRRYQTPVTDTSAVAYLKTICLDIFELRAWKRASGSKIPEKIQSAADHAYKQLMMIAEGKLTLGGAEDVTERQAGGSDAIITSGNLPQFDRDKMGGF